MSKVNVIFMNKDGDALGQTEIDAEQLPDTFAVATTLHMGADDWEVISADPLTKDEFVQTGKLQLIISRVDKAAADEILFSMPTIANALPETCNTADDDDEPVELHEDMWRQNEFLSKALESQAEAELETIKTIWGKHSIKGDNYTAFSKCHLRKIGEPELDIMMDDLAELIKSELPVPLKLSGTFVKNGFALKAESGLYYGISDKGHISVLCAETDDAEIIRQIAERFDVMFVSWCGCVFHKA